MAEPVTDLSHPGAVDVLSAVLLIIGLAAFLFMLRVI